MKITDLRIGDRVQNRYTKFQMTVVAIFKEGTVYLDFEGNEGDVWEENVEDLEFCEPRYKLPEWRQPYEDRVETSVNLGAMSIGYEIDEYKKDDFTLFLLINNGECINCGRIGKYPTLEAAKEAAEKHYNELVSELINKFT